MRCCQRDTYDLGIRRWFFDAEWGYPESLLTQKQQTQQRWERSMHTINPWQTKISPASPVHWSVKIRMSVEHRPFGIYFDEFLAMLDSIKCTGTVRIDHLLMHALRPVMQPMDVVS